MLGGDEYPEHDVRDRGQAAHSLIFVAHRSFPPVSGARRAARSCQIRLTGDRMTLIERRIVETVAVVLRGARPLLPKWPWPSRSASVGYRKRVSAAVGQPPLEFLCAGAAVAPLDPPAVH